MDYRYLVIAGNIILFSALFIIIGLMGNATIIVGAALSMLTLGIVIFVIGLTYTEPLGMLYRKYSDELNRVMIKLLEDLDLVGNHIVRTCKVDDQVFILFSKKDLECTNINVGIGLAGNNAYLALPVDELIVIGKQEFARGDLSEILRFYLVTYYGICRDVIVDTEGNEVKVSLIGLPRDMIRLVKQPINPLKILIPALTTISLKSDTIILNEELLEDTYIITLRRC